MTWHAPKSPSQADKFANCAGSLAIVDALPDHQKNISGHAAKVGTCVHKLIEVCLQTGQNADAFEGRIIKIANDKEETCTILAKSAKTPRNEFWIEVDDDVIADAALFLNYVRKVLRKYPNAIVETESRTNPLPDRDDTSGTADTTLKIPKVLLEVVDYKNGYILVVHKGNRQLLAYLLGKAIEAKFAFPKYKITVVQPNAEHEDGRIRSVTVTAAELKAFQKRYRKEVEATDAAAEAKGAPKAGFKSVNPAWAAKYLKAAPIGGEKDYCMFCDAKAVCPAYIARRSEEAAIDFNDDPEEFVEENQPKTEADVSRILAWAEALKPLFTAAYMYGLRSAENGFGVPGFKLVRTTGRRQFLNLSQEEIAATLRKVFKLKDEQIFRDELKTGPQIEKLLKGKELKAKFNEMLLFVPEGKLSLVPDDHKKEAVLKNAADDFDDEGFDDGDELDFG